MLTLRLMCFSWYAFLASANPIYRHKILGPEIGGPKHTNITFLSLVGHCIRSEPPILGNCGVHTRTTRFYAQLCQPIIDPVSPSVLCNLSGELLGYPLILLVSSRHQNCGTLTPFFSPLGSKVRRLACTHFLTGKRSRFGKSLCWRSHRY